MTAMMRELALSRHLLFTLTWRDIRIRYKQTVMGFLWALFMPLLIVASGLLVRKAVSVVSGAPINLTDAAAVSVKALPWAFFVGAIRFATNSLTSNSNLVAKIYFPREVLPLSAVLAQLFDMAVAVPFVVLLVALAGLGASAELLWLIPIVLALLLLTAGCALFLSCANLFYRDIKYIVEAALTFGIFFTPVFYDASQLGRWGNVILLNPVSPLLQACADVVIRHETPNLAWFTYAALWAVLGSVAAWKIFDKAEAKFAENV